MTPIRTTNPDRDEKCVSPELDLQIALGRGALAAGSAHGDRKIHENGNVGRLLALLWHERLEVRRAAALALAGGDRSRSYRPHYGHFANSFLRQLHERSSDQTPESTAHQAPESAAHYGAAVETLRTMLAQSAGDIRGLGNMHYSFLSSALYLALLVTCRDVMESVRRLRAAPAHPELCRLLSELTQVNVVRRLNAEDAEALSHSAGRALAAMPPDEIPEFWRRLRHEARPRRRAYAPALRCLHDRRAAPHLLHALTGQPEEIAQPMIACLGRLGDARALTALTHLSCSRNRLLRSEALAAIAAIQRAEEEQPASTLLRPAPSDGEPTSGLLRPIQVANGADESPEMLLRPDLTP